MNWFWRAAASSAVGACCIAIGLGALGSVTGGGAIEVLFGLVGGFIVGTIPCFVSAAVFHLLTVRLLHNRFGETRCRHCAYILRGIPEPRGPECGERL
jgi:hypothetical protein